MKRTRLTLTIEANGETGEAALRKVVALLNERLAERATIPDPPEPEPDGPQEPA